MHVYDLQEKSALYGCMGVWECGCMGVWECGCMGVCVYGSVGTWVCKFMYGRMGVGRLGYVSIWECVYGLCELCMDAHVWVGSVNAWIHVYDLEEEAALLLPHAQVMGDIFLDHLHNDHAIHICIHIYMHIHMHVYT